MIMLLTFKQDNSQATQTVVGVYRGSTVDLSLEEDAKITRGSTEKISEFLSYAGSSEELDMLI